MPEQLQIIISGDAKALVAELKKAGVEVGKFGKESETGGRQAKQFGLSLSTISTAASTLGLAGITREAADFVATSIAAADEARAAATAFEHLSGGTEAAAANMDAIARATTVAGRQVVDETTRMQIANQLMGMQIANSAGELEKVIEVSRRLGGAFRNMGAAEAAEEFAIMMSNMSVQRLDSFGISSGRVRERINELMESTAGMTREQAFFQATMEEADATMARLGPEVEQTSQAVAASKAAWADFTGQFGEMLQTVGQSTGIFDSATAGIQRLQNGARAWGYVFGEAIPALQEHNAALAAAESAADKFTGKNLALAQSQEQVAAALHGTVVEDLEAFRQGFVSSTASFEDFQAKLSGLSQSTTIYGDELALVTDLLSMSEDEYTRLIQSVTDLERVRATEAERLEGLARAYGATNEALQGNSEALASTASVYQQYGEAAAESYNKISEAAAESFAAEQEMRSQLIGTAGEYYGSLAEMQSSALEAEESYSASLSALRGNSAEQQKAAAEELSEELTRIEEERQEKLHWVMTGAHARTAEQNAADLAHWNAHYDALKTEAEAKTREKVDAVLAEESRAAAAAQAARDQEKAEAQAHLEELKLMTALSVMETTGQLEQMTGLVGISAGQAAELISAGVLPVTEEMGMSIQNTMANMEASQAAVTEQATANQTILQEAYAGTLVPLEEQNLMFAETLPESLATMQESAVGMTDEFTMGVDNVNASAMVMDESLLKIGGETLPAVETKAVATSAVMVEKFGLVKKGSDDANAAMMTGFQNSARKADGLIDSLNEIVDWLIKTKRHADAARAAIESMMGARAGVGGSASSWSDVGHASGTGGRWLTVPGGYPNDTYMVGLTTGEKYAVMTPGEAPGGAVAGGVAGGGGAGSGGGGLMIQGDVIIQGVQNPQQLFDAIEREGRMRGKQLVTVN